MVRLALIMTVAIASGCAATGWRRQTIDGSSQSAFERSVASLQTSLPSRRRAEFETSLAVIWMRDTTVGAGDLDSDGLVEAAEARPLADVAERVLAEISRGDFMSEIGTHGESADRYVKQLSGLRYDEVIELADLTSGDLFIQAAREQQVGARCRESWRLRGFMKSSFMSRYCRRR
jgi:hypothetical protein